MKSQLPCPCAAGAMAVGVVSPAPALSQEERVWIVWPSLISPTLISPTKNQCVSFCLLNKSSIIIRMATSLYQGLKENEQGVNCTYLYQEKPLRSGFKEYLPVPVPRETFDIRYPYQEKPFEVSFQGVHTCTCTKTNL